MTKHYPNVVRHLRAAVEQLQQADASETRCAIAYDGREAWGQGRFANRLSSLLTDATACLVEAIAFEAYEADGFPS